MLFANYTIKVPVWLDKICVWPMLLYRRFKYGEPFRKIDLGEGAYTKVDPDVYYEKCRYKWFFSGNDRKGYATREMRIGSQKTKRSCLHREIVKPRKGKLVDHRDNDSLNNLRSNLRQATHSQNTINRPKRANTSSKYIGVYWNKQRNMWRASIRYMQKGRSIIKHLCYTSDESDAARAYDMAALKYHKDFARTNFGREDYVKAGNGYKLAEKSEAAKFCCPLRARLCKICSSIPGWFGKQKRMKGRLKL